MGEVRRSRGRQGRAGPAEQTVPTAPPADFLADAWNATPRAPAEAPEPPTDAPPALDPDDAAVGLRKAQGDHLPELTLAALRWARANDPDFPAPVDKRGAELLYRVGDLKRWARHRARAATGTSEGANRS